MIRDNVLTEKYYINKTSKAPNPMRFTSPVISDFSLIFLLRSQHQPGLLSGLVLGVGFLTDWLSQISMQGAGPVQRTQ